MVLLTVGLLHSKGLQVLSKPDLSMYRDDSQMVRRRWKRPIGPVSAAYVTLRGPARSICHGEDTWNMSIFDVRSSFSRKEQ